MSNTTLLLILFVVVAGAAAMALGWFLASRRAHGAARIAAHEAVHRAAQEAAAQVSIEAVEQMRAEQADNLRAAVDTVMSVASSKLGDQLEAGRFVIGREREQIESQVEAKVGRVETELKRVADLVSSLQQERAQTAGQLSTGIRQAMAATEALTATTTSLREALASPKARGQWGERMAEDVLRAAGFIEGTSYVRQRKLTTGGVPDYTFLLPADRLLHMDVKFPVDNYLRWLESPDEADRPQLAKAFKTDVRNRVKELTGRGYIDPDTTVDYLLLFVPNESVYGFLHEHDPDLIDFALGHRVVLCSPTTLFAVLAVIRQSMDNFHIEQRSHEILAAVSGLRDQWDRWCEPMDKMRRGLDSAQRAFDELQGKRTRAFERQLEKLEGFRDAEAATTSVTATSTEALDDQPALRQVI